MSDQELAATVRAAQRGDAIAMAALVDELMPYVGTICGAIALQHGEDAAQDALIAVLRNLRRLEEPRALRELDGAAVEALAADGLVVERGGIVALPA